MDRRKRIALLLPSSTYRAADFVDAVRSFDAEVTVVTDSEQAMANSTESRFVEVDFSDPVGAAESIVGALAGEVDGVVGVDDQSVETASLAGQKLGLSHNPPAAVAATRDKLLLRRRLAKGGLHRPNFGSVRLHSEEGGNVVDPSEVRSVAESIGYPVVAKPSRMSGSRGVIRADSDEEVVAAATRIASLCDEGDEILIEEYMPGDEIALEGLLYEGNLSTLAVFDKPDPLTGPYFEETIFVTPSRHPSQVLADAERLVSRAVGALGLREGPIHAEIRIDGADVGLIEVASRSIGGHCSRALRFAVADRKGVSLEELIIANALGQPTPATREKLAAGVMMIPISRSGTLRGVWGLQAARAEPFVEEVEVSIPPGRRVEALPEGDRYLGFIRARATTPEMVESALRGAASKLDVVIEP